MTSSSRFCHVLSVLVAAMFSVFSAAAVADHIIAVELYYDGGWQDHTDKVRYLDGVDMSYGASAEGQESPPARTNLTLDNRDGAANPQNPASALYGVAGRNTPLRVTVDGSVRSTTEVASWAPERAHYGKDPRTPVEGAGIQRRLQQGNAPLRSALYRATMATSPLYYWPLEDPPTATEASPAAGLVPLTGSAKFGTADPPAGSAPVLQTDYDPRNSPVPDASTNLSATLTNTTSAMTTWRIEAVVKFPGVWTVDDFEPVQALEWRTLGTATDWILYFSDTDQTWTLSYAVDGVITALTTTTLAQDGDWHHVRIDGEVNAGDTDYSLTVDGVVIDSGTLSGVTSTAPSWVRLFNFETVTTAHRPALGHIAVWDSHPTSTTDEAWTGHTGELAGVRFLRLCTEEGITGTVIGDEEDTVPMGPQSVEAFIDLIRECAAVDDAILTEPRDAVGLEFRPGRSRYNQDPVLTLDLDDRHFGVPLTPGIDDQHVRNDVTATRAAGGEYQAVQTAGPLNVGEPTTTTGGVGRYTTQISRNTATVAGLADQATWQLHLGTIDEPRWARIVVDLDRNPSLATDTSAVTLGDIITLTSLPEDWAQGDVRALVVGIEETATTKRRVVTFVTMPGSAYEIGLVGANDGSTDLRGQIIATDNSELDAGIDDNDTALSVASTGGVLWTTDADDWNAGLNGGGMFIEIGGELMQVTNITGGSSPQTFTVTRSTNGVVKSHAAGAPVHAAFPIRVAL
jgi:hypothetical protein